MPQATLYQCTLATCSLDRSIYHYRPSLAANCVFLALFALTGLAHVVQGVFTRRTSFWIAVAIGCVSEIIGYVGRILSYNNPFDGNGFLTQIVCITIAPAFFTAGIYFCLGDMVKAFPPEVSRVHASGYAKIFIPCDIVSLILQGVGGGMASVASQNNRDPSTGTNIMVAGLSFQVASLALFIALASEYCFRLRKWKKAAGTTVDLPSSRNRTIAFAFFFCLAVLCIFIRCVYRVAELSEGWGGHLIHDEPTFIGLEGCMVLIAVYFLHIGHPGVLTSRKHFSRERRTSSALEMNETEQQKSSSE